MASTTRSPLEFFGETVAAAGGKFTGEKYTRAVDDIFTAAASDTKIEMVVTLRRGTEMCVLGLLNGKMVSEPGKIRRLLMPIVTTL